MAGLNELLKKFNWKHFLSYLAVGGAATLVEWSLYGLFVYLIHIPALIANVPAMIISTFSNWLFGRLWTFKGTPKGNVWMEIGKVYLASIVGILLNELILWGLLHFLGSGELMKMICKVIATGVVFLYNYLVRVLVIYRKKQS